MAEWSVAVGEEEAQLRLPDLSGWTSVTRAGSTLVVYERCLLGSDSGRSMVFELHTESEAWCYAQICFSETFAALRSGILVGAWRSSGGGQERQPGCSRTS